MDLPIEIIEIILSKLDSVSLAISKRVCYLWNTIINNKIHTKSIIDREKAIRIFLSQGNIDLPNKLFISKDKMSSVYIRSAIKSGSNEIVWKLIQSGFSTKNSIQDAIKYHQNDLFVNLRMLGYGSKGV